MKKNLVPISKNVYSASYRALTEALNKYKL